MGRENKMNLRKIETIIQLSLYILLLTVSVTFTTKNEIRIERVLCPKTKPESAFQDYHCIIKFISRTHLKFDVHWNITRPMNDAWIHAAVFYKFNGLVYHPFPIDLWENMCDWISGKTKQYILDWTFGKLTNYTNFNRPCPFYGYYYVRANNISMDHFVVEPLLPAGRYRLTIQFTHRINDPIPFTELIIYFSVSDYRLEII